MFLISYDLFAFSDLGMFQTNNGIGVPNSVELTNSMVDELHIKQATNVEFISSKDIWLPSTVILAKFMNDLHCGNITLSGLEITHLKFKKRKTNSLQWITFHTTPFSKDINTYETIDRIVEANEEYEYGISPATSTIEGDMKTDIITVQFDGMYISDKDSYYKLLYNLELGDIVENQSNSVIETLGNKYPTITYGSSNYKTGSIKCMLISDTTVSNYGAIDVKVEKALRNQITSFLTNRKPKILKDSSGNFLGISVVGSPKLSPRNELNQQLYDLSFEFIEVIDLYNQTMLIDSGLA